MAERLARAADVLERLGLSRVAFALYERISALRGPRAPGLPPAYLRVRSAGTADPRVFAAQGERAAAEFVTIAARHGGAPGAADSVLDFGCGCGRVAAPFTRFSAARFHGCDIDAELVAWCAANLPGAYQRTARLPPLPYGDASFDMAYALSVFTHMRDADARSWLAELARIVRPGGMALLTLFDEAMPAADRLKAELQERGFAIRRRGADGSNLLCGYFTRSSFAARAAPAWQVLEFVASVDSATGQTVCALRRV